MSDSAYMQGDKDNAVQVPFSDDTSEAPKDDIDDDSPDASPEQRRDRQQKRAERTKRMLEEGKAHAAKVKELEERDAKRQREIDELRGAVAANQNFLARQQQPAADPYEAELDAIYERQTAAHKAAQAEVNAGNMTPERTKYWEGVARDIESSKTRVHTAREVAKSAAMLRQEQARQVWEQKHPEVYKHPQAFEYAKATFQRRLALGESSTNQMVDEIMEETKTQFRLGAKPAPTASDRARLSGLPAAGSGGGGKAPGVALTPELRKMAEAAYPELSQAEAHKKWTNGVGRRLREKKVL